MARPTGPVARRFSRSYVPPMHTVDATTEQMIRSVHAHAENRLRLDPVPLDHGFAGPGDARRRDARAYRRGGPEPGRGDGGVHVDAGSGSDLQPRFLGNIPAAPTKASLLFDMLVSCASIPTACSALRSWARRVSSAALLSACTSRWIAASFFPAGAAQHLRARRQRRQRPSTMAAPAAPPPDRRGRGVHGR